MKKVLFLLLFYSIIQLGTCVYGEEVGMRKKFMEDTGFYRYYLTDDYYVETSEELNAVVNSIVRIRYNDYVTVMVYKDGEPQKFSSGDYIFDDGEYSVVVKKDDTVGRIMFVMDTVTAENINIEDSFYNDVSLTQTYDSKAGYFVESINIQPIIICINQFIYSKTVF